MAQGETDIALLNGAAHDVGHQQVRRPQLLGPQFRRPRVGELAAVSAPDRADHVPRRLIARPKARRTGPRRREHHRHLAAEFDTQIGRQKYTFTLKADGAKLTGKAAGQIGEEKREPAEIKDGKVQGDEISFSEPFDFNGNAFDIKYTGKLAAGGGEIKLTRKVGDFCNRGTGCEARKQ
jgi:hypothetical protein